MHVRDHLLLRFDFFQKVNIIIPDLTQHWKDVICHMCEFVLTTVRFHMIDKKRKNSILYFIKIKNHFNFVRNIVNICLPFPRKMLNKNNANTREVSRYANQIDLSPK